MNPGEKMTAFVFSPVVTIYYFGIIMSFRLRSEFRPQGDQPQAIEALVRGLDDGSRDQVLLGITGSGKSLRPISGYWWA